MASDFPDDVLTLRRTLDGSDADLHRLHAEYADRPDDPDYRKQVAELRAKSRAAAVALSGHPYWGTVDKPGDAKDELQRLVAEELAASLAAG